MNKLRRILSPRNPATRRTLLVGAAFIAGFVVLALISIQGWEYSNSVDFCTTTCHDVHPEEPAAFQNSYHARVKCTECHMGRVSTLQALVLKSSHFKHLPAVLFDNYERPLESETMRPANESCERCHWPSAFHGDTILEIRHFESNKKNTAKKTYLILKTGGGERDKGLGFGIHWHIENPVEYIATDERKQDIRWVRTTLPDGRTVEYNDITQPLSSEEELEEAEIRIMDCVDCHNRVGHPFPYPEQVADSALVNGQLSTDLPFAKYYMTSLLSRDYLNREAALAAADSAREQYIAEYPEAAAAYPNEIAQAAETAQELLPRLVFEEPGVNWQSFPDNSQHRVFAGCFRCHDGKHLSPEGESIRLHCNICHSIPITVDADDRPPQIPITSIQEPESHREANFVADHRFQANDDCVACHGAIEFGSDDSSFCANSACHGQAWPSVELDAAFPHPIELEGKHAEAWCHDCHEGIAKPEYTCSKCHEPPSIPHFGTVCEDCHTPAGFSPAKMDDFQHPVALEGKHAELNCLACHSVGLDLTFDCAACHQPPARHLAGSCDNCHTPEGFSDSAASIVDQATRIPHSLEEMEQCLQCHGPDQVSTTIPADHKEFTQNQCTLCHKGG